MSRVDRLGNRTPFIHVAHITTLNPSSVPKEGNVLIPTKLLCRRRPGACIHYDLAVACMKYIADCGALVFLVYHPALHAVVTL